MNQLICDNKISEVKALEALTIEEFYSTLNTYCKIVEEKNKAYDTASDTGSGKSEKKVARSMSARRTSSTT